MHLIRRYSLFISILISLLCSEILIANTIKGLVLPYREVTISSLVEGRIEHLMVREGDSVSRGDSLVQFYDTMERLEAQRAEAASELREFEYKSSKNLFDENVISEDEALQSRIELDLAKLTYEMAEEQVALRELKSPISGIVVERYRELGEMVQRGEPILTLVDLSQVYVQFYVAAEELENLSIGKLGEVRFPSLGMTSGIFGPIDFIDPRVDAASGLLRVRILLNNESGVIKAGVRATVDFTSSTTR